MRKLFPKPSPFADRPRPIVHGTYHKMGTVWLTRVLESVAAHFGMIVHKSNDSTLPPPSVSRLLSSEESALNSPNDSPNDSSVASPDVMVCYHSQHPLDTFGDCTASHMIRDPRDVIVSGYFYHLWTDESWAHIPQDQWNGDSYQQHLKGMDQESGLSAEIDRFGDYIADYRLMDWNYNDPRVIEIRYEELIRDEQAGFENLFQHYGFHSDAVNVATRLAMKQSFQNVTRRSLGQTAAQSHLRSGKPGEWRSVLSKEHCQQIKNQWGDLLVLMAYETNHDW